MSYNPNSLKGGYIRDNYRVIKGDTRSLVCGPCRLQSLGFGVYGVGV